jgi:nucleotide-binding universal stress UspA family protein
MYRNILVPLDGSTLGEQALPHALGIARRAGATLHLVHVHTMDLSVLAEFPSDKPLDDAIQKAELAYLDTAVTRIAATWDGAVNMALRDGVIVTALHDYALEHTIDLVVLTSHGRGGIVRAWLGSTADLLVRTLSVPVLIVRPQDKPPNLWLSPNIEHILVPLDGSPLGEQVLGPALDVGGDALRTLTLLHTVEPIAPEYMGLGYGEVMQRVQRETEERSRHYLAQVAARLHGPGLMVHTHVEVGAPASSALYYAEANGVDLIALATHGRGGLARFVIGSIADKVARGAHLPVLLYHPTP